MSSIPLPNINYNAIKKAKIGELVYSKTNPLVKSKWLIKDEMGKIYVFDNFDSGLLAELIFKRTKKLQRR